MTAVNETERVMEALARISGVARVTRGWAREPTGETLPCVVLHKSGESGAAYRDDNEYLTRVEYTARVFAALPSQADALAAEVRGVMETLGYARTLQWEESDGKAHQRLIRFQRYI